MAIAQLERSEHLPLEPKICAWCDRVMGVTAPSRRVRKESTNHGLCPECIEQLLDSLLAEPQRPSARQNWPRRRVLRNLAH